MLKYILLIVFVIVNIYARPQFPQDTHAGLSTPIPIVTQYATTAPDGSFNNSYETANGIKVQSSGFLKKVIVPRHEDDSGKIVDEHEEEILVQTGSYSYTDPDGNVITISYVADENGFQPTGDHLPKLSQQGLIQGQLREGISTRPSQTFQPLVQTRPIQPLNPQNQLQQGITSQPSLPFQQFNQNRPIQQFNPNQQFPQFGQSRTNRQSLIIQDRLPQERPIQDNPLEQVVQNQNSQHFPAQQFDQQRQIQSF